LEINGFIGIFFFLWAFFTLSSFVSVSRLYLRSGLLCHIYINFVGGFSNYGDLHNRRLSFDLISLNGEGVNFFSTSSDVFLSGVLLLGNLVKPFLLFDGLLLFDLSLGSLSLVNVLGFILGVLHVLLGDEVLNLRFGLLLFLLITELFHVNIFQHRRHFVVSAGVD
jgi:hypothetical protein